MKNKSTSEKANHVLKIFLCAFLIIGFRVWHLGVIQRDDKKVESQHPKRRALLQRADRGTIADRFGEPLAVNKICYNAAIYYNQISQIPATSWRDDASGKRVRSYPRREYIHNLATKLSEILQLDSVRVEDLIHSKASLFPHVPFIAKSGLSESEHYKLAALEKDWLGIHAEIGSERFYPKKKVAAEILGTMGAISSKQYLSIAEEIKHLQAIVDGWSDQATEEIPFETARQRLQELKEKAYTIQDLVGKTGVESQFEEQLRGFYGKKLFEVDPKGKCLKEQIGSRPAIPGQQLTLTISAELQELAEALLAENETFREGRSIGFDATVKERRPLKQPWSKGGSIVAMDPNTGEIIAMASTPRFDPNDFIPSSNTQVHAEKQKNICRWLENERLIGAIWDGKSDLVRERFNAKKGFYEEATPLKWEKFIDFVLAENSPLRAILLNADVKTAVQAQEDFETLLYHFDTRDGLALLEKLYPKPITTLETDSLAAFKRLEPVFATLTSNGDKLLLLDFFRLAVYAPAFTDESIKLVGALKIEKYRSLNQSICRLEDIVKERERKKFRDTEFKKWRETEQKNYLAEMRAVEKEKKLSAKPYIDHIDTKEKELFQTIWSEQRLDVLAAEVQTKEVDAEFTSFKSLPLEQTKAILHTFRSFSDLGRPLVGSYRRVRKLSSGEQTEKHLAASFYPLGGFGCSSSFAFQSMAPQGSIFKLVTAYAALAQTKGENPLNIIDELKWNHRAKSKSQIVATTLSGTPYLRMYKGGRLPRSHLPQIGKIDLIGALEQSSNSYFSILAGDCLTDPEDLNSAARLFGFGARTGIDLPGESKGKLPDDLSYDRTGLYSTAIGQHKLLVTPLQTAVMLSAIANGGKILKPILAKEVAGALPNCGPLNALNQVAQDDLQYLGISFPLFTAAIPRTEEDVSKIREKEVLNVIDMPKMTRFQLLEGMDRVVWSSKGTARSGLIRGLHANPTLMSDFLSLKHQMVGKTGTAEVLFNPNINPSSPAHMYKHIWFSAIAFDETSQQGKWDKPELVVAVYLRYGDGGKEAAPLAAQIIKKWRALKSQNKTL
jgi:cell division protein FtsI/penicillin-binding protein 2